MQLHNESVARTFTDPLSLLKVRPQGESLLWQADLRTASNALVLKIWWMLLLNTETKRWNSAVRATAAQITVRTCPVSFLTAFCLCASKVQCAGLHLEQGHALRLGYHRVPGHECGGGRGLGGISPPLHDRRVFRQEATPPQERKQAASQTQVCVY